MRGFDGQDLATVARVLDLITERAKAPVDGGGLFRDEGLTERDRLLAALGQHEPDRTRIVRMHRPLGQPRALARFDT